MDMGCYPISLLRLLAAGPRVISAEAKLSSPGVDRAMDAHFSLPDGGSAHIGCSMFSSSVLRLHAEVTGDDGKVSVFNPFAPQHGHRMKVTTTLGTRKERFSRRPTYDYQLEAFVAAVEDGASFPTTAVDAIRTMELIDAIYMAAGLPVRQPTPDRPDAARAPTTSRRWQTPRSTPPRAARRPSCGSSASAARRAPARRPARDHGGRHRIRHGRARRGRRRRRVRRLRRRAARGGGRPRPPGPARWRSVTSRAGGGRVELAPEPSHGEVTWSSAFEVDPADGADGRQDRAARRVERAASARHEVVSHTSALAAGRLRGDLPGRPQRDAGHPAPGAPPVPARGAGALRVGLRDDAHARPAGRPRLGVPDRAGRRRATGTGTPSSAELPELLAEKLAAPSVEAGTYDLVVDPSNLWLTIHESIGHATELDRAVGYEAAYAGTSFATFDQLGTLRLRLAGHARHRRPHRRARPGHRRHRRRGRRGPVVRPHPRRHPRRLPARPVHRRRHGLRPLERLRLRRLAACTCRSSAWPTCRCAHAGADGPSTDELIAGVDRGIYVVGDKSWSIDMQRYNFQFTGQRFYPSRTAGWPGRSRTSPTRPPRPISGAPWRPWAARRPGCSVGRSTAARASPARWRRSRTAARRSSYAASTSSTPGRSRGADRLRASGRAARC